MPSDIGGSVLSAPAKRSKRRRYGLYVMGILAILVGVFDLTGPAVSPLMTISYEGVDYWAPNVNFYTELFGGDSPGTESWDVHRFLARQDKPANGLRVVVFGESAAIGDPPDCAYGFWRILEKMLQRRFPGRAVEVLPMAYNAMDSYCMYWAAQAAVAMKPDYFVVYMGNNEVTGTHGVINPMLRMSGGSVMPIRAWDWVARSRTARTGMSLLQLAAQMIFAEATFHPETTLKRMAAYSSRTPEFRACITRYETNLFDICQMASAAGAKTVLCTMAVNLRDWAPFYSSHGPGWKPSSEAEWQGLLTAGGDFEKAGRYAEALGAYQKALSLDDQYAQVHFLLGRCFLQIGDKIRAREHFHAARELDGMQARSNDAINNAIQAVARDIGPSTAMIANVEQAIADASPDGIPGFEMFYDCVHFQFLGAYHAAQSTMSALQRLSGDDIASSAEQSYSFEQCEEDLAFLPEMHLAHLDSMDQGMLKGLRDVLQRDWHVEEVKAQRAALQKLIPASRPDRPLAAYHRALELYPADHVLQARYLQLMMNRADFSSAYAYAKQLPAHPPYRAQMVLLGKAQLQNGLRQEGTATLQKAAALYPDDEEIRALLREAHSSQR